eukprot:3284502-Rhodomonas_salina.1
MRRDVRCSESVCVRGGAGGAEWASNKLGEAMPRSLLEGELLSQAVHQVGKKGRADRNVHTALKSDWIAECHHLDAHADTGVQFEMSEELRYMTIGAVISGQHSAAAQLTESEDSEDESDEEDDDADDGFRVVRKRPRMGTGH